MVGIRDVPGLGVDAAVVKIVLMVEERAREKRGGMKQKLLDEKDGAGFFSGKYSKPHEQLRSRISWEDVP